MKRNRGFTLMEMLIVVAIIAVLAAIAIPVFNGSLHKAKVAADMANVRVYYAELQTQYITTGEYLNIGDEPLQNVRRYITFLDGTTVQMQAGIVSAMLVREQGANEPVGYQVYYQCDKGDHKLLLE
ncbi:MAG: prepilin-type N-terminal cleavage/methylation domain-containing protein [Clostridiales bacterium]|nr:prepilin-type N-terminal cleavage/methylation domain-containing protein [Clostridiales bacterium]